MKTKDEITLTELREKWKQGGLKRAANLTPAQRMKISRKATRARKANAKARREAKSLVSIETPALVSV